MQIDPIKMSRRDYDFNAIETKWQRLWESKETFSAKEDLSRPKYYVLDMFPYPSGTGLHIGHPEGYTASDILARYFRAKGYNVLHPMGWDAFGLPAEQHAVQTGIPPEKNTAKNIQCFREQIRRLGFAIDWSREINTTDPRYYRWTQWIFLQLFKHGLAYVDRRPVWWCPALKTVLANEEVIGGRSERGDHPVERRLLRQWVLRITAYAEQLLSGLETLDWPESTKRQQIAWIGKSQGAEVQFSLQNSPRKIDIFTTRPDTLFGVSYLILAPEHALVEELTTDDRRQAVGDYQKQAACKSDLDRTDLAKIKSGVFTGAYARHPLSGNPLPIWISDYVLASYGNGAVMGVPAHDGRDFAFAKKFSLSILPVIRPKNAGESQSLPFCEPGILMNSGEFDGLESSTGGTAILDALKSRNCGSAKTCYKLRDWLFSRQRYWGEPIPILWVSKNDYGRFSEDRNSIFHENLPENPVHFEENGQEYYAIPLPEYLLPLELPPVDNYQPSGSGESPLSHAKEWLQVQIHPQSGEILPHSAESPRREGFIIAFRETNTMPQWAGSCWYSLRYLSPREEDRFVNSEAENYWGCPDFYIGGAEHAVLHLLYARFWHQFLHNIGKLTHPEPFPKLFHQGIILGEDGNKMSKSRGNVVNPDAIIGQYGADTLRLYEMFLGPLQAVKPWNARGIEGVHRFLKKTWRYVFETLSCEGDRAISPQTEQLLHQTIAKVTEDIEDLQFNTAISSLMILLNRLDEDRGRVPEIAKVFIQLLAPFAPHISEELWQMLGERESIVRTPFPAADLAKCCKKTEKILLQINGKLRGEMEVATTMDECEILQLAKKQNKISEILAQRHLLKEIYVPHRIINFVVR